MRADPEASPDQSIAGAGGSGREVRHALRRERRSAGAWRQLAAALVLLAAPCAPLLAGAPGAAAADAPGAPAAPGVSLSDPKAQELLGDWLTQGGEGIIRISIAANGTYEGRIVGAPKSHLYAADVRPATHASPAGARGPADPPSHAADPPARTADAAAKGQDAPGKKAADARASRYPHDGVLILRRLKYDGHGKWSGGTIEDPRTGLRFGCRIELLSARRIQVRGFLGISLLGHSQIWTRYRGDATLM